MPPELAATVVLTRAEQQLGEGRDLFETAGFKVLDLPALVIGPPDEFGPLIDALKEFHTFHWCIFSSANGVDAVESQLQEIGQCLAKRPTGVKLAAVGRKTAALLEQLGAPADFVPPEFVADSLLEHFPVGVWGQRILLPRVQSGGRSILAEAFGEAGARVVEVAAYESRCPSHIPDATKEAIKSGNVDAICFSSAKTVCHSKSLLQKEYGNAWQALLAPISVISIGPQTSRACWDLLGRVDAEADPHHLEGLVSACQMALSSRPPS
jgi:uroporphyrinogen-III synthase